MNQEKQEALEAIRKLATYYRTFLNEEMDYTSDGSLIKLNKEKALVALRYGIPIGFRSSHCDYHGTHKGEYGYSTVWSEERLDKCYSERMYEYAPTIHAGLPAPIQKKMLDLIDQIMEIESPEQAPEKKEQSQGGIKMY